jgi:hypothetical protein
MGFLWQFNMYDNVRRLPLPECPKLFNLPGLKLIDNDRFLQGLDY